MPRGAAASDPSRPLVASARSSRRLWLSRRRCFSFSSCWCFCCGGVASFSPPDLPLKEAAPAQASMAAAPFDRLGVSAPADSATGSGGGCNGQAGGGGVWRQLRSQSLGGW